jgi:hypothetical protein
VRGIRSLELESESESAREARRDQKDDRTDGSDLQADQVGKQIGSASKDCDKTATVARSLGSSPALCMFVNASDPSQWTCIMYSYLCVRSLGIATTTTS